MSFSKIFLAAAGTLVILTACGGGGSPAPAAPPVATSSTTVSPSLGMFSAGTVVNIAKLDGTLVATGSIGSNGSATIAYPTATTGPLLITVVGAPGVTYFDEGTGRDQEFGAGAQLQAVTPSPTAQIGVTALTHSAVASLVATNGLANATQTSINNANAKIGAVFGLPDILIPPNLVSAATSGTLDLAIPADRYALVLAAIAKSAPSNTTIAALVPVLASDLSDSKLNGLIGKTVIAGFNFTPQALSDAYQAAGATLANSGSTAVIASTPLVITPDVSLVAAVSNQSDVNVAKAMFSELRTTLKSFSNENNRGSLDTQATRFADDLKANVTPELPKVADRVSLLGMAVTMFEDGKSYSVSSNHGLRLGSTPATGTNNVLFRSNGTPEAAWYNYGSYDFCWTDSASGVSSKVSCLHAGNDSADRAAGYLKFDLVELTGTALNQYTYKVSRVNALVVTDQFGRITNVNWPVATAIPFGEGSLTKATSGTTVTGLNINGTFPPSAVSASGTIATGIDTISVVANRTSLAAANNFRYALAGSVSTTQLSNATKVVTLALESGTYIDVDESNSKLLSAKFTGSAQTASSKFIGGIEVAAFMSDADGKGYSPTNIVFTGTISDPVQTLTGKLEASVSNYPQYHSTLPNSVSNYLAATVTLTGTIQAVGRPQLKLVVSATKTGLDTTSTTLNYSYGAVNVTGSGISDSRANGANTLTLSNQDGISVAITNGSTATVSKSGVALATITNGVISYIDGYSETLF